jgi:putative transposase
MARIARVVVPGMPHHVTQRGVRRMDVFFSDDDRIAYLDLLSKYGRRFGVSFLAWCLMTNHIHLIAVPEDESSLARGIGEAHRRYTRRVNFREGWRGYLFQGRFQSCPLDGCYLLAAVRYVLRNPVRAGIVDQPWDYEWSSAQWIVGAVSRDPLAQQSEMLAEITDWKEFLRGNSAELDSLREHTRTGRPLGNDRFIDRVESHLGRSVRPKKRGPKKKD